MESQFKSSGKKTVVVVAKYDCAFQSQFQDVDLSQYFSVLVFNSNYKELLTESQRSHFDYVHLTTTDSIDTFDAANQQNLLAYEAKELEGIVGDLVKMAGKANVHVIALEEEMLRSVARIRETFGLPGLYTKDIQRFCNKPVMLEWFSDHCHSDLIKLPQFRTVQTVDVRTEFEAKQTANGLASSLGFPIILKHANGSGALGAKKVTNLPQLVEELQKFSSKAGVECFVAQQFITGEEIEGYTLVKEGRIVLYEYNKLLNSLYDVVVERKVLGAITLDPASEDGIRARKIGETLLAAMQPVPNGNFFMQMIHSRTDDNWYFVENTIRVPGDVVPRIVQDCAGVNIEAAQMLMSLPGNKFPYERKFKRTIAGMGYPLKKGKLVGYRPFPESIKSRIDPKYLVQVGDILGDARSLDDWSMHLSLFNDDYEQMKKDLAVLMQFDPLILE